MGRAGKTLEPIEFLRFEEVLEINRRMITTYGGFFTAGDNNLANPGSLKYTLDMIQGFGFDDPYPTVIEKAAILAWRIMRRHVFHDGNKRTGIESCRLMLDLNGYTMSIDRDIIGIAIQACEGNITFQNYVQWVEEHIDARP